MKAVKEAEDQPQVQGLQRRTPSQQVLIADLSLEASKINGDLVEDVVSEQLSEPSIQGESPSIKVKTLKRNKNTKKRSPAKTKRKRRRKQLAKTTIEKVSEKVDEYSFSSIIVLLTLYLLALNFESLLSLVLTIDFTDQLGGTFFLNQIYPQHSNPIFSIQRL